jgi:hypothetical protein
MEFGKSLPPHQGPDPHLETGNSPYFPPLRLKLSVADFSRYYSNIQLIVSELSASRFVDGARIDPGIHIAIFLGLCAYKLQFDEGCRLAERAVDHIRKENFI